MNETDIFEILLVEDNPRDVDLTQGEQNHGPPNA
jgi:hypothetical protein